MPTYGYLCDPARDGCGTPWKERKAIHDRDNVICPFCSAEGYRENYPVKEDGKVVKWVSKIVRTWEKAPGIISDIDNTEGRIGEAMPLPTLAPNDDGTVRTASSRRQLEEHKKRSREKVFNMTDGKHTYMRPFTNDKGETELAPVTTETQGYDGGGFVNIEGKEDGPANDPKSSFAKGETLAQTEARLKKSLGE